MRVIANIVVLVSALFGCAGFPGAAAQQPQGLDRGPYAAGFRSIERYDYSRVFREKLGPDGAIRPGERARPVYLYLWYPAETDADAPRMVYGEYSFASPADPAFYPLAARLQEREIYGALYPFFGGQRGSVVDLMSVSTRAVRDAKPLAGSFPVVIYHPDLLGSAGENALLCEYLASHGYVVAAAQSIGALLRDPRTNADDLDALVRDKEFIIAELHDWPQGDRSRLALVGKGFGAVTALVLAARDSDVDAVVTLGDWAARPGVAELLSRCSGYRPERISATILAVRAGEQAGAFAPLDSLVHATRYLATMSGAGFRDFTAYAALAASMPVAPPNADIDSYSALCRLVRTFLDGVLGGSVEQAAALEKAAGGATLPRVGELRVERGVPEPLREDEIVAVFWEEGVAAGVSYLERLRAGGEERPLAPATLNTLGYQFLAAQRLEEAIEIFKEGTSLSPGSANAWASLGESYMYAGNADEARACFRKTLDLVPADSTLDQETREALKTQAEGMLERLGN